MTADSQPCPDTEALCGMVEGRLGELDRALLERHLAGCSMCRRAMVEVGRALGHEAPARATSHRPPSLSDAPASSQRLGRYEIRREVGLGGMGVVYEGWDPALSRRVALKLIRPDRLELIGPGATEQLATEARALANIAHPNVLTVFDVGIEGDAVFIAAEYIEGVTMDKGFPHRARAWRDRLDAYLEAARGLSAIHASGITHRDIKPANILLSHDGRVKIADFGLAVRAGQPAPPGGTPAFMAPEQARGEITPAADQYALAVCMAEALLGARLSAGTSVDALELKSRAVWGESGPPRALWVALSRSLSEAPEARFPTVEALVLALEAATRESAPASPAPRAKPASWRFAALAAAVLAAVGIAFAATRHPVDSKAGASSGEQPPESNAALAAASAVVPIATSPASEPGGAPSETGAPASAAVTAADKTAVKSATGTLAAAAPPPPPIEAAPSPAAPTSAENPVMAAIAQQEEATKLLAKLPETLATKDGKRCLALLDQAQKLAPQVTTGMTTTRATCEMMAGKCDQAAQRVATDSRLGAASKAIADNLRATYCPAGSSQSTPQERLKAVMFQAAAGPYSAARCEQFVAQTEKAIKDHGSAKPDATTMAGAWSNTAMCFAWIGNCQRTAQIVGKLVSGPERDEKIAKWVKNAHPNCAKE